MPSRAHSPLAALVTSPCWGSLAQDTVLTLTSMVAWSLLQPFLGALLPCCSPRDWGQARQGLEVGTYLGRPRLGRLAGPGHSKGALSSAGLPGRQAAGWTLCGLVTGHEERTGRGWGGRDGRTMGRITRQEKMSPAAGVGGAGWVPAEPGRPPASHVLSPVTAKGTGSVSAAQNPLVKMVLQPTPGRLFLASSTGRSCRGASRAPRSLGCQRVPQEHLHTHLPLPASLPLSGSLRDTAQETLLEFWLYHDQFLGKYRALPEPLCPELSGDSDTGPV